MFNFLRKRKSTDSAHSGNPSVAGSTPSATPHDAPAAASEAPVDAVSAYMPTNAAINTSSMPAKAETLVDFIDEAQMKKLLKRTDDVMKQLKADWNAGEAKALFDEFENHLKTVTDYQEKLSTLEGTANNVKDAIDAIVDGLGFIADSHPILKIAWILVKSGYKMAKAGTEEAAAFGELSTRFLGASREIHRLLGLRTTGVPLETSRLLSRSIDSYVSCLIDVADSYLEYFKAGKHVAFSLFGRTSQTLADLNERLDAANADLRRVRQDGTLEILVAVAKDVVDIKNKVTTAFEQMTATSYDRDFDTLREHCTFTDLHSAGEIHALSHKRHRGTRDWIINHMVTLITSDNDKRIFWLQGEAGTGKSVIAGCVASALEDRGVLAASFFCQHDNKLRDTIASMIQTLAYELAGKYPSYRKELLKSLQDSKFRDSTIVSVRKQLEVFFINPFSDYPAAPNHVIVIDALDELEDHVDRNQLLEVLNTLKSLKTPFKLFITSRPNVAIPRMGADDVEVERIDVKSKNNHEDIRLFTQDRVAGLVKSLVAEDRIAPDPKDIADLVTTLSQASNGLFIWITLVLGNGYSEDAAGVIEEVWGDSTSTKSVKELLLRLEQVASMDLRSLYCRALCNAYRTETAANDFKVTVGIILCAKVPLSLASLKSLVACYPANATINKMRVSDAHAALKSLIKSGADGKLAFIHKTVPEYLLKIACHSQCGTAAKTCKEDTSRHCCHNQAARRFQIDSTATSLNMAHACLGILNFSGKEEQPAQSLFRNMGKLDGSKKSPVWFANDALSETLEYAVTFWSHHFFDAFPNLSNREKEPLIQALFQFSKTKLPYYLEALLLLGKLNDVFEVVTTVTSSLSQVNSTESSYIRAIFTDLKFIAFNFRKCLMINPLQVYEKPVMMVPLKREYFQAYHGLGPGTMTLGQDVEWGELTLTGHASEVKAVAVSHNGQIVVSGSSDHTVKLWSVWTGECIKTFRGHSNRVTSAAISADGQTVVSGSIDKTVKVWSVHTGESVKNLVGHLGWVLSAAISSDGERVVSGSIDKTVKVWSIPTGKCVNLVGHLSWVFAVAISSDGKTVVSGSDDKTVKLWSADSGNCVNTLVGHSSSVTSVAISSDGATVVSGSIDKSIKLWLLATGKCIKTFEVHSSWVFSVAISLDGQTVVSGSYDGHVRQWSVRTEKCIKTLVGHSNRVFSVAISLDGQMVVSGSDDKTVKLWSLQAGYGIKPFRGHSKLVTSVAISLDGKTVVSGSNDRTVKLWSVLNGECINTFVGHSKGVTSVAISSDGLTVVSGSADATIKLWSVQKGWCSKTLVGHSDWVTSVSFLADGDTVASESYDKTLKEWSINTGKCSKTLAQPPKTGPSCLKQGGFDKFQNANILKDDGEEWISQDNVLVGKKGNIVYICR
ncbi:WD40-repeat-containing domain protein [Obelidium mucronatum]|nr:WD40-repeat-containing domain protein [Obelidium mucronatum]